MKRIFAIILTVVLLCGGFAAMPVAAAQPVDEIAEAAEVSAELTAQTTPEGSFRRRWNYIRYRSTLQLQYTANVPVTFSVSENALGITVDNNGRVTSGFSLRKYGHVTITMRCAANGNTLATTILTVDADMWQWMIIIFLFGWFWY